MKNLIHVALGFTPLLLLSGPTAHAATDVIRASSLRPGDWQRLQASPVDQIVEFRQGDHLPLTTLFAGDLLETIDSSPSYLTVKRNFFFKLHENEIFMSLDGKTFEPLQALVHGSVALGASGDVASAVSLKVEAYLKR